MRGPMMPRRLLRNSLRSLSRASLGIIWWVAGAVPSVIEKLPARERLEYGAIGMTVLGTTVCAFFATAYTVDLIFDHIAIAVLVGGLWAVMTLLMDRLLLAVPRPTTKIQSLLWSLPRVILALVVGILIAYPIQLRIFTPEIEQYAQISRTRDLQVIDKKVAGLQEQLSALELQAVRADRDVAEKLNEYLGEIQESEGSVVRGLGPQFRAKQQRYEDAVQDSRQLKARIYGQMRELSGEVAILQHRRSEMLDRRPMSFLARTEAFTALRKQDDAAVWASGLLTALIVLVQIMPLMAKLLRSPGLYDYVVEPELHEAAEQRIPDLARRSESMTRVMQSALADALDESRLNPKRQGIGV